MCTYVTESVVMQGSGKGPDGWFKLEQASVYFDHPVHLGLEHSLNIDFINPGAGAGKRVAVELSAESARELAETILKVIDRSELAGDSKVAGISLAG